MQTKDVSGYYPPLIKQIDWAKVFLNSQKPDILDIGCGKGTFLLNMSEIYSEKNCLGIEVRKSIVDWINEYIYGEKIPNCSAVWYSVVNGLNFIADSTIEKVFYLFPDPWPKRKHLKRRAFNDEFVSEVYRILNAGAKLYLATDLAEVNKYHKDLLLKSNLFDVELVTSNEQWQFPVTNKEMFCIKECIEYFRLICTKKS